MATSPAWTGSTARSCGCCKGRADHQPRFEREGESQPGGLPAAGGKLRAEGVIRKTVALLEPAAADMATLVIVGVVLDRSTPEAFTDFEEAARGISGCLECHLVAGSSTTS